MGSLYSYIANMMWMVTVSADACALQITGHHHTMVRVILQELFHN